MYEVLDSGKHGLLFRLPLKNVTYIVLDTIEQREYQTYYKGIYFDNKWGTFASNISCNCRQATQNEFDVFCHENPFLTDVYCNMNVIALANMDIRHFPEHVVFWKEELNPLTALMDENFLEELGYKFTTPKKANRAINVCTTKCRKRIKYF